MRGEERVGWQVEWTVQVRNQVGMVEAKGGVREREVKCGGVRGDGGGRRLMGWGGGKGGTSGVGEGDFLLQN